MTLDNEDAIAKALGEKSLGDLSAAKLRELVNRLDEIPPALQLHLIKTIPGLQLLALEAVAAVGNTLGTVLASNDANTEKAFAALAEIRGVISGELQKEDISDERWMFLMEKLGENGQMVVAKDTENKRFIAQQANADRLAKGVAAAMPYVLQFGVQILIRRGS